MGWKATLFAAIGVIVVAVLYIQARTDSDEVGSLAFMGILGLAGGYLAGTLKGMDDEAARQRREED